MRVLNIVKGGFRPTLPMPALVSHFQGLPKRSKQGRHIGQAEGASCPALPSRPELRHSSPGPQGFRASLEQDQNLLRRAGGWGEGAGPSKDVRQSSKPFSLHRSSLLFGERPTTAAVRGLQR